MRSSALSRQLDLKTSEPYDFLFCVTLSWGIHSTFQEKKPRFQIQFHEKKIIDGLKTQQELPRFEIQERLKEMLLQTTFFPSCSVLCLLSSHPTIIDSGHHGRAAPLNGITPISGVQKPEILSMCQILKKILQSLV